MSATRQILIGSGGGSGSGRTLVAKISVETLGSRRVVVIPQDADDLDIIRAETDELPHAFSTFAGERSVAT